MSQKDETIDTNLVRINLKQLFSKVKNEVYSSN